MKAIDNSKSLNDGDSAEKMTLKMSPQIVDDGKFTQCIEKQFSGEPTHSLSIAGHFLGHRRIKDIAVHRGDLIDGYLWVRVILPQRTLC